MNQKQSFAEFSEFWAISLDSLILKPEKTNLNKSFGGSGEKHSRLLQSTAIN